MIDLNYLATAFNRIIGTDKYLIYVFTNAFPEPLGNRNAVTMNVTRVPFGFESDEFNAESMNVTFTFDLPANAYGDDLQTRDIALEDIRVKLLGRKKFTVVTPDDEEYIINCAFEQQPPPNPYLDSGRVTQQIVVSGTVLVQEKNCLAIIGNDVKVSIDGVELLKTTHSASVNIGSDNNIPLSENNTFIDTVNISRINTKSVSFMYTGKEIENEFIAIAEGAYKDYDINKVYEYKVEYIGVNGQTMIITTPVKIVSASLQTSLGVFLQYTLNLVVVSE
jgi:hypothetical protein